MHIFYRRPLFTALFLFIAADLLFTFISTEIRVAVALAAVGALTLSALILLLFSKRRATKPAFLSCLLCLLAVLSAVWVADSFVVKRLSRIESTVSPVIISGQIRKCEFSADYESDYTADIQTFDSEKINCTLLLTFSEEFCVNENERFTAVVQIEPFPESEYGFNTRAYRIAEGVFAKATVTSYQADGTGSPGSQAFFAQIKRAIEKHFDRRFDGESAALAKALLLGDKSDLADTFVRDIRRLGVGHILAISGTHFSVLLGMATLLFSLFGIPKKVSRILLIPIAIFYMAITGFSPSVVRAGVMAICGFLAFLFGRQKDGLTALTAAVALYLSVSPHVVYSVGLWLSFTATFVILLLLEYWQSAKPATGNFLLKLLWIIFCRIVISVLIFAVTLPICALAFGEVSFASILGNLTVVPLLEILIYVITAASLLPPFSPVIGFVSHYTKGVMLLTAKMANHDGLLISIRYGFVIPVLCAGIFASFLLVCLKLNRKRLILLPLFLSLALTAGGIALARQRDYGKDTLYYFSCFGGDAILLKSQNRTLLLDISDGQNFIRKEADALSACENCPDIHAYMLTHYHQKHIRSLRALCCLQRLTHVYLPPCETEDEIDIREQLIQIASENGVGVIEIARETPMTYGRLNITLCEPQKLKKSAHPVYAVWLSDSKKNVLYCPASAAHLEELCRGAAPDLLLVGFHTPRQKEAFSPMAAGDLIFANENLAALSAREGRFVPENGSICVDLY